MPTRRNVAISEQSRVFLMEGGAGPAVAPEYMGHWKAGAPSWDFGEATPIEIPSDSRYGEFDVVANLPGARGKPSIALTARYTRSLSEMLRMARQGCYNDVQIHFGLCQSPTDFTTGWDKIMAVENFRISNYSADDIGALGSDERTAVNETINCEADDLFEILPLKFAEICAASVIQEVVDVTIADERSCGGECGDVSDGCSKVFGLVKSVGGSPGLGGQVIYSEDGGSTCGATIITTLPANEDPDGIAGMGTEIIVVSEDSESHHWAVRDNVLIGTETWQEVTSGYVAGNGPRAIFVLKPGYGWAVGANGYVYAIDNAANPVTVLDAGSSTGQDLNDVHAFDEENVLAVGDANAVIVATDGQTFTSVTGPAPAVNLNCCWMQSDQVWWVGTAGGRLYYTRNSGATWIEKTFAGSGAGSLRDIAFHGGQVGYICHDNFIAGLSHILRTIDGGYSWYVLPEGVGSIPANTRVNALAICDDPNLVIGGGLASDGVDGFMVRASA